MTQFSQKQISNFQNIVWDFYREHKRDLPWRENLDPYHILLSEIMLQQTQAPRVIPKYLEFLEAFPTITTLSAASFVDVLRLWSGLGYNRRAKFLHQTAQKIHTEHAGVVPDDLQTLVQFPGIGTNTASAILAYAYNKPVVFIETNIRTVYLHHFFPHTTGVSDQDILPLVRASVDTSNAREWYWALMDYGTHLKKTKGNQNIRSKHYLKQSKFFGSRRQKRGAILRSLLDAPKTFPELADAVLLELSELQSIIDDLVSERFIYSLDEKYFITHK